MIASNSALRYSCTTSGEDISLFELIAQGLEQRGIVIIQNGLPSEIQTRLLQQLHSVNSGEFMRAGVGRGDDLQIVADVRRNKIAWIDPACDDNRLWLEWVNDLRLYLNKRLFLGLFSFESHFAKYLPGDYYQKHVDAFKGMNNRVLSLVTYLNDSWQRQWGGGLVIYDESGEQHLMTVTPQLGTLVLFLSEDFPHEVLPASETRYSVAGWFSVNRSTADRVDPPS